MHGFITGIIANIGRNILDHTLSPDPAQMPGSPESTAFSSILASKKIDQAKSLGEILQAQPGIGRAELLEIEQNLKIDVVSRHMNLDGDVRPLAIGDWTIEEQMNGTDGIPTYTVSDHYGHTLKFRPHSAGYEQIGLIKEIQDHLHTPSASPLATLSAPHTISPAFTVPPFSRA